MESVIQKKLFNKDECNYFKSLSDIKSFKRSKVTDASSLNSISEFRTSSEVTIQLNYDLSNTILDKLKEFKIKS